MFYFFHQRIDEDGSFESDHVAGIGQYLIVEANSAKQAYDNAKLIGIRDLSRWTRIENLSADQQPSLYGDPISGVEYEPDEIAHDEIGQALAYIHYLDGRVEAVVPQIRLDTVPFRKAADHELGRARNWGGWRDRVQCGVCEAEFTVPKGTDIETLVINGCRGAAQGHPNECECPGCEPL